MPDITVKDNLSPAQENLGHFDEDIQDICGLLEKFDEVERLRLSFRNRRNTAYPNAPNWVEPVIDDNTNSLTSTEHNILWQPQYIANFIPLSAASAEAQPRIVRAFDHLIKMTLQMEGTINILLDMKNILGMSISKVVIDPDFEVPTIEYRFPQDTIVPINTRRMKDAARITDIHRFSVEAFRKKGKDDKWANVEEVIQQFRSKDISTNNSTNNQRGYRSKFIEGSTFNNISEILIYEAYYIDDKGNKKVIWYPPDAPDKVLKEIDWKWKAGPLEGNNREWPHDQFRYEDRNDYFYDVRGTGRLLKDNQQSASQFMNLRGMAFDFLGTPMFTTEKVPTDNRQNVFLNAGSMLPPGVKPAPLGNIPGSFDFAADLESAKAARRVGSVFGSQSSINRNRDRKTATEVDQESENSGVRSTNSIMRFTRPLSRQFDKMWQIVQAQEIALPIISSNDGFDGELTPEELKLPFIVTTTANSRTSSQSFMLRQMTLMSDQVRGNPGVDQTKWAREMLNLINPELGDRVVTNTEQGSPIEQQLVETNNQIQSLAEQVVKIGEIALTNQDFMAKSIQAEQAEEAQESFKESLLKDVRDIISEGLQQHKESLLHSEPRRDL